MSGKLKKVVFIMGSGHCGPTLLDLILGSHSSAFSLGEFNQIRRVFDDSGNSTTKICGVCSQECPFWDQIASERMLRLLFSNRSNVQKLFARLLKFIMTPYDSIFKWSNKDVLIDSSKKLGWFKRQLFPRYKWHDKSSYLIYMLRDGRAVVNSYYRKYPERGFDNITMDWKQQMVGMNSFYDQFPENKKMKVCYENLATKPEETIKSICDLIGIEYEREMLNYWVPEHHHVSGNAGTRSLIFKFREQFGYEMTNARQESEREKTYYSDNYYNQLNLAIKLDERWKEELSPEHLDIFERLAGDVNESIVITSEIDRQ